MKTFAHSLLAFLVALVFACTNAHAQSSIPDLTATIDPVNAVTGTGKTVSSATLHLVNKGAAEITVRIEARRLALKGGTASAKTSFDNDLDHTSDIAVPGAAADGKPGQKDVAVKFTELTYYGVYEGSLDVVSGAAGRTQVPIRVNRDPSPFTPVVRGESVTNNIVTLKPMSGKEKTFSFIVENPATTTDVDYLIEQAVMPSGVRFGIEPSHFKLAPGSSQPVELTLEKLPPRGTYGGSFVLVDADHPDVRKEVTFSLQPAFTGWFEFLGVSVLVGLGLLVSWLMGTVIPNAVARRNTRAQVRALKAPIDELLKERKASVALEEQRLHLVSLIDDVWWSSPKAADDLAEIGKQVTSLAQKVTTISNAADLRTQAHDDGVPVSIVPQIERQLDHAIHRALTGDTTGADAICGDVDKRLAATDLIGVVKTELAKRLDELATTTTDDKEPTMKARLAALLAARGKLADASDEEVLRMDRECFAAHLYYWKYLGQIMVARPENDKRFGDLKQVLLEYLREGGPGLWLASDLLRNMEIDVLPEDLDRAIADGKGKILNTPLDPKFNTLIEFHFVFDEPRYNDSPLANRLPMLWYFSNHTNPHAIGPRCFKFFLEKKGFATMLGNALLEFPRFGHVAIDPRRLVRQVVFEIAGKRFTREITLAEERASGAFFFTRPEVIGGALNFLLAIGLTWITHGNDVHAMTSVQDYITPFIWGFGLSQLDIGGQLKAKGQSK